ncbi:MAG TPA: hypothetical protein VNR40_21290 [Steroidobacter sp.]|nr:hypothetical protein [Steroidobacter sp.]
MRPITDVLREARGGRVADIASSRLAELVQAVDETGKPGAITITIKVKPEKGGGSQKQLSFDVKAKLPEHDLPEATFFSDADGNLHRTDPAQREMFSDAAAARAGTA